MKPKTALAMMLGAVLTAGAAQVSAQGYAARSYDNALSSRTKVLGVAVLSGYRAQVVTLGGLLGIGAANRLVPRDDGLLADSIYAAAKSELDKEERYEIKRLRVEPEQARQFSEDLWNRRGNHFGRLPEDLKSIYADCQCDAVLVITDGPSHNTMVEAGLTYGPSWAGKAGMLGGKEAGSAHMRVGVFALLMDPRADKRVSSARAEERPDYEPASAQNWPGTEGPVSEALWQGMAKYLGGRQQVLRQALYEVGLRPSCALPFFERGGQYGGRNESPPSTLPGSDPSRCQ